MFFKKSKEKRHDQLSKLSSKLDMKFHDKDEFGLIKRLAEFHLFRSSGSKKITNLLLKEDLWRSSKVAIFDLKISDDNNSGEEINQTVFFVESKELSLPHFFMRPEAFFDRVGKYLRLASEIEFEEHPEFCKNYWVKGDDEYLVKKMVTDDFAHFFTIEKNWRLEGMNFFMIFYQNKKLLKPTGIEKFYRKGTLLFEELKDEK